jgi:hypothetical protein
MLLEFLNSPNVALLVLAVLAVEACVLGAIWLKTSKGLNLLQMASFLGAGACFALCLYGVLSSFGGLWVGGCLTGAFIFHICDLRLRWRT